MRGQDEDFNRIKEKIARYCAYREVSSFDARQKMQRWGASEERIKKLLKWLKDECYVDDRRFAIAFARGKHSQNQWGKIQIAARLRLMNISDNVIEEALSAIDAADYENTLLRLARKKWDEKKEEDIFVRKQKVAAYLSQKGYEAEHIWKVIDTIE